MIDSTHEQFEELAAGYALDALSPEERRDFETHVDGCPRCAEVLAGFFAVASNLAAGLPQREPTGALRDRLVQSIRREPQAGQRRARGTWFAWTSNPVRYAIAAGLAALSVASALLLVWVVDLRDDNARHDRVLALSYEALSVMADAEQRWEVDGTAAAANARGIVAYDRDTGRSSIVIWGLDEHPDMQYNLWVRQDAQRTPVGRLYAADGGYWAVVQSDMLKADGLGVTQVRADGQTTVVIDAERAN